MAEPDRVRRLEWGRWMQTLRHSGEWYFLNLVWADLCNNVLPLSFKKAQLQAQARKRGKKWMSEGSQKQKQSKNLPGP